MINSILKQHKLLVALAVVAFCVTGGLTHATTQDPAGTATETIDLLSFKSRSGGTLAQVMKQHSLAMVLLVDPNCATCASSTDTLRALRDLCLANERADEERAIYERVEREAVRELGEVRTYISKSRTREH